MGMDEAWFRVTSAKQAQVIARKVCNSLPQ